MQIVIMGCGRVGSQLANLLFMEGHKVSIIDLDIKSFERLGKNFKGDKIVGFGYDREVLIKAGIEKADAFASVSPGDNRNIIGALVASREFKVPIVVARIYDPVRAIAYNKLGIVTISPTKWGANKIKELICHQDINTQLSLGNGEVEIIEVEASYGISGYKSDKINVPGEIMVISITRLGKSFIPVVGTVINEGDLLHIAVASTAIPQLKRILGF
ncbi:MAG: Trk system potassium uptake protein TrkA [Actinobacteria bacterium ADurb.Bin346]|nr:MAG: Trk system potassium uptake protein TrkA [Actinobacteria bacterium ADurb.Bin346]